MSGIVGTNAGRSSGKVGTVAVGADAITGDEIADDVLDSEHYVAASIDNEHLADGAAGTDEIADNAVTLAKMAGGTDGNLISYDTSGNPVAVAAGNDGQVLTSAGAGAVCLFEDAAGGGKVLQVVSTNITTRPTFTVTDTSGVGADLGLSVAITPVSSSSKFLVNVSLGVAGGTHAYGIILVRDSTRIGNGVDSSSRNGVFMRGPNYVDDGNHSYSTSGTYYNTTSGSAGSAITFRANGVVQTGTGVINRSDSDSDVTYPYGSYTSSSITVTEIGA